MSYSQCLWPLQCSCKLVIALCIYVCSQFLIYWIVLQRNVSNVHNIRYAWILLVLFQFLASNVSLLGHLCGILSGFACLSLLPIIYEALMNCISYYHIPC